MLQYFLFNFFLGLLIGKPIISALTKLKGHQSFRDFDHIDAELKSHCESKKGTPTIGGLIFLIPAFLSFAYFYLDTPDKKIVLVAFAFLVGASLGFADDLAKVIKKNHGGVNSWTKLLIQVVCSSTIVYLLNPSAGYLDYGWAFLVIAGSSNAINLTDGIDGLASTINVISFLSLGYFLFSVGDLNSATISSIIIGGLLAFFVFNKKPAKVFMGDTGSLALGMGLGALAYVNNLEWYLLIFALVPVLETLSVILQVGSAKLSRKFLGRDIRPFKMAPLHHHFELIGFSENKVVLSFAIFQILVSVGFFLCFLK